MIRKKAACDLESWITDAGTSLIASFASGINPKAAGSLAAVDVCSAPGCRTAAI